MTDHEGAYQKRDIIIARMDANLSHLVEWSKSHTLADEKHQINIENALKSYQEKTDLEIADLKSFKFKSIGAVSAILFIVNLIITKVWKF